MPRRRSLTRTLYRAARLSNNARAASRGPGAYAKRVVRRKTYSKSMGATGRFLRMFGLKLNPLPEEFRLLYLELLRAKCALVPQLCELQ